MFKDVRVLASVNITVLFFYSLAALFILPQFEELFKGFGAELPLPTLVVMRTYPYWWLIPLIMLGQFLYFLFGNMRAVLAQRWRSASSLP
jgi:type IV pilus assembly protein PilC